MPLTEDKLLNRYLPAWAPWIASSANRPSSSSPSPGIKSFFYDLPQSAPLIRIGCLLIFGISLYLGGWL